MQAHRQRKAYELREYAIAMSLAYHEPKSIDTHIRAPEVIRPGESPFETEIWW